MKATKLNNLHKGRKCFFIDHKGEPKQSHVTAVHEHSGWYSYEVFGLALPKMEGHLWTSKDEMIASFVDKTSKL